MANDNITTYEVSDFSLGLATKADNIIFLSVEELDEAYKDIDNGKDFYIKKDGVVYKILRSMVVGKIADGKITLGAKEGVKK